MNYSAPGVNPRTSPGAPVYVEMNERSEVFCKFHICIEQLPLFYQKHDAGYFVEKKVVVGVYLPHSFGGWKSKHDTRSFVEVHFGYVT